MLLAGVRWPEGADAGGRLHRDGGLHQAYWCPAPPTCSQEALRHKSCHTMPATARNLERTSSGLRLSNDCSCANINPLPLRLRGSDLVLQPLLPPEERSPPLGSLLVRKFSFPTLRGWGGGAAAQAPGRPQQLSPPLCPCDLGAGLVPPRPPPPRALWA